METIFFVWTMYSNADKTYFLDTDEDTDEDTEDSGNFSLTAR